MTNRVFQINAGVSFPVGGLESFAKLGAGSDGRLTMIRVVVGALAGFTFGLVGFALRVTWTSPDPRSVRGLLFVVYAAVVGGLAGVLAAAIGRRNARAAGLMAALLISLVGLWSVFEFGRDFYSFLVLCVLAPFAALGAEAKHRGSEGD